MKKTGIERAIEAARKQLAGSDAEAETPAAASARATDVDAVRLTLAEADEHAERIVAYMSDAPGARFVDVAGGLRRRCDTVDEILLLVAAPQPAEVMRHFTEYPQATAVSALDVSRGSLTLECGINVDLRVVPPRCFGATHHHLTGADDYDAAIREMGLDRNIRISEYGVFKLVPGKAGARRIGGRREEDVFEALHIDAIPPELRENRGELEAAARHALPQLITIADIRGDLHLHISAGTGQDPLNTMVRACHSMGYDYCAISDRLPADGTGRRRATLRQHARTLAALRRDSGMDLLLGIDANIGDDGSVDVTDEERAILDIVVASIHSPVTTSGSRLTERIIRALRQPSVDILAHPPAAADMDAVLGAATAYGVAVEISPRTDRPDFSDSLIRTAKELGTVLIVSSNAHAAHDIPGMRYAVDRARRGWVEPDSVLNARDGTALRLWLARRRDARH
ncbi:hypothetical protein BH23GEM9_BH23GEM9_17010 [soil metagenome]